MARGTHPVRPEGPEFVNDETSETAPKTPNLPRPKSQRKKGTGPRFNPMKGDYWNTDQPLFPKPD